MAIIPQIQEGNSVWYIKPERSDELLQGEITKVGRKYFYISRSKNDKFPYKVDMETMCDKTNYGYGYSCKAYLTEEQFYDELEQAELTTYIRDYFQYSQKIKLNLRGLRAIKEILDIAEGT